jgi:methionyl-tRNA synthetase
MTGFFVYEIKSGNRMAYHCDSCSLTVIFAPDEKPRTWCCGKYVEYEEPKGLFAKSLPRVLAKVPAMVLRQRTQPEDQNSRAEA